MELSRKLGICNKVYFIGSVPHNEIPEAIAAASVVFDPCPIGQGINILEAMACAKPTVGIKTNGLWDYIVDKQTGFLVDFNDEDEIAEKIIYLLENPEEARLLGLRGRKLVERMYDINKRIDKITTIYKTLLDR